MPQVATSLTLQAGWTSRAAQGGASAARHQGRGGGSQAGVGEGGARRTPTRAL